MGRKVVYTSDSAYVVRCKDCKHYHRNVHDRGDDSYCDVLNMEREAEWYCADGERRDGDDAE